MEGAPEDQTGLVPEMPPQVSKRFLMFTLLAPPVLTLLPAFLVPFLPSDAEEVLFVVPMMLVLLIPGLAFCFRDIVAVRYRGISVVFLVCSYLLGQFIGCIALLIGIVAWSEWLKG